MLAGSTDYHLGGFRAVPQKDFKAQYTRPLMLGTRCHLLAMYVVLENYLGMVCDYPAAYEGQPGFEFIKEVPTTWDETKVPAAQPGEYIVLARRKGADWYVGVITNLQQRDMAVTLSFLPEGNYEATIFADSADAAQHPNSLVKQTKMVNHKELIKLKLAAGGGAAIQLKRQ